MVKDRWFPIIDLACAVAGAVLWFGAAGQVSWQPLFIVLTPWLIRASAGQFPFRRTPFDLFILIFMLTALVGVWVAYDRATAWSKFWVLVSAVFLYYSLAGQSRRDAWLVAGFWAVTSGLVSVYFLFSNNWRIIPADIGLLQRIGLRWMQLRPNFQMVGIHPNAVGGILAILIPFLLAFGLYGWRRKQWEVVGVTAVMAPLTLFGFLMTSSRAAWLSLAVALGLWVGWWLTRFIPPGIKMRRERIYGVGLGTAVLLFTLLAFLVAGDPMTLLTYLPGADNTTSRLELIQRTLQLWQDFPYTGGGLAAFAGLYSNYIAVTPFFLFSYGHNFWLDVLLEQGIVGLFALLPILMGGVWLLRPPQSGRDRYIAREIHLFRWAVFISTVTLLLHGLMDDALYGTLGTPLLFVLPGLCVAFSNKYDPPPFPLPLFIYSPIVRGTVVVAGVGLFLIFHRPLLGNGAANLGAVAMARVELARWPTNRWDNGRHVAALAPAAKWFNRALALDPLNRTAHHRLGLIAMLQRDYQTAVFHLSTAYEIAPDHRGIIKSLGYSYVWVGKPDEAAILLDFIPEAQLEMVNYSQWWQRNGRSDLAKKAADMAPHLHKISIP